MSRQNLEISDNIPEADRQPLADLYSQIGAEDGLVYREWHQESVRWNPGTSTFIQQLEPQRMLILGIIAAEEYDLFYADKVNRSRISSDRGENSGIANGLARGQGETGVSVEGLADRELALARQAYKKWQKRMEKLGNRALWGTIRNNDGFGRYVPRKSAKGPWTISVSNAEGKVFETSLSQNFGGFTINPKERRY